MGLDPDLRALCDLYRKLVAIGVHDLQLYDAYPCLIIRRGGRSERVTISTGPGDEVAFVWAGAYRYPIDDVPGAAEHLLASLPGDDHGKEHP